MPYSQVHKQKTRAKIVEAARMLFNKHGFEAVTIDMVMQQAGLTRGGFYNHFKNKQNLYAEAVDSFLMGRGSQWRQDAGIDINNLSRIDAQRMLKSYLSAEHLQDLQGQCPMIALPTDVGRADEDVKQAYQKLLQAMVWLFEQSIGNECAQTRQNALSLAALSIGGMVIAKALPASELADEVRNAAYKTAKSIIG